MTIAIKDIEFYDWGIRVIIKENDKPWHVFTFYRDHLPFRSSPLMEKCKKLFRLDTITVKGKVKIRYNTRCENDEWKLDTKYFFDSRFDDPRLVVVTGNLEASRKSIRVP
jgi:hypothetical protein